MGWFNDTNSGSYSPFTPGVSVGLRNVGSYQVSGHPFVTASVDLDSGSTDIIEFPYVTKQVTIRASGSSDLKVHFTNNGKGEWEDGLHFIRLSSSVTSDPPSYANPLQEFAFDVKCKEIFITSMVNNSQYQLYASLTNIPTASMYALSGPGLTNTN